jgi:steroid delta-isomerase-like uncharacterized protein
MTSERNKEILEGAASNFAPATLNSYVQLYDEDARLHFLPPGLPHGRAGARIFYAAFFAAFPDSRLTLNDVIAEGDKVACRFSIEGTHRGEFLGVPATEKRAVFTGITMLVFRDGQCIERWSETNLAAVLRQLAA